MIWMIRHTTPAVDKGICYGQTNLDLSDDYAQMRQVILQQLPHTPMHLHSSPLLRCHRLALDIAETRGWDLQVDDRLMEMHFGQWEMRAWNEIPEAEWKPWMDDFVQLPAPGGESFLQLHERCGSFLDTLDPQQDHCLVTHGGIIRSALCRWHQVPLSEAFTKFKVDYGAVVTLQ